jgi:5'-deoxynucleotidase
MNTLREILNGLAIKRYHTKRVSREQTVADHSARICAILCHLVEQPSGNLLRAAIYHDVSEFVTGDLPSPVKWKNPELRKELNRISTEYEMAMGIRVPLTEDEARLLRWADSAEGCQYCIDELELGNLNLLPTLGRYVDALNNAPSSTDQAVAVRQRVLATDFYNYYHSRTK